MRDTQPARAVQEFAIKLERIEAQKAPIVEEKRSIMKMILGKDFNDEDKAEDMRQEFENQKKREKANLIVNFSIPNTKEDIMDFMLLASSNINPKYGTDDIVSKAWISKLDQVYQKAEMSMRNNPDFAQIKYIYDQTKKQIRNKKIKQRLIWIGGFYIYFFLMGLLWDPTVTIAITVVVIVLIIIGFAFLQKR